MFNMSDRGLTHIALPVSNVDASIAFYSKYARMQVVHRRTDRTTKSDVAWISDLTRPFAIVLIEVPKVGNQLLPIAHLGVACENRQEMDYLCDLARSDDLFIKEPKDDGYPVGYWAFIRDPDGHTLEISYGQEIGFTIEEANSKEEQLL
jgi:catechol 2,3-dioxygenase-like lactoylglutathione lyase family enzyme